MVRNNIFLAVDSLIPGNGGICRVARLMAKVFGEELQSGHLKSTALVLSDTGFASDLDLCVVMAGKSRMRFAYKVHQAAFTHSHFIYDSLGLARAHCRLPLLRKPLMAWIHGIEIWEHVRPDRLQWARRADFLVSNSSYTRERAENNHGGFKHAKVCWLATETDELPIKQRRTNGPPVILIMGRLDEGGGYKGHSELIECWPEVLSIVPEARLVIVGTGPGLPLLQCKATASGASKNIEFRGFIPEEQIDDVWAEATVFAMPSRGEGFGLTYIEAMRHSLPVISSIHDAASEINLEGKTGYNVNLDKPEELTERLLFLLKNPEVAIALGKNGQQRWFEHFRYSAFRTRFTPLLYQFIEG